MDILLSQRRIDTEGGIAFHRKYQREDGTVFETTAPSTCHSLRRTQQLQQALDALRGIALQLDRLAATEPALPGPGYRSPRPSGAQAYLREEVNEILALRLLSSPSQPHRLPASAAGPDQRGNHVP